MEDKTSARHLIWMLHTLDGHWRYPGTARGAFRQVPKIGRTSNPVHNDLRTWPVPMLAILASHVEESSDEARKNMLYGPLLECPVH
jgi:hypothetical protein